MELDLFISLIDRIIKLLKTRSKKKQQFFDDVIESLYLELQPVVDDYFNIFRKILDMVRSKNDFHLIFRELERDRERLLQTRIKVKKMAEIIENEMDDKNIIKFTNDIWEFFRNVDDIYENPQYTKTRNILEKLELVSNGRMSENELIKFLENTIDDLELSWEAVSESYAVLRLNRFKP